MTAFPQTPNKKIDRKAFAAPDSDVAESENDFEPPATAVEETLAGLWCRLLCVKRVGRRDNFFRIRRNSLLAMQLVGSDPRPDWRGRAAAEPVRVSHGCRAGRDH